MTLLNFNWLIAVLANKPKLFTFKANGDLCINNTCINENDLKRLKGENPVYLAHKNGRVLQAIHNGNSSSKHIYHRLGALANTNKGTYERMYLK